ncbi:hypothetical protein M431DRAFT_506973 [Trichoderma harzianum CBS 226.95]|uniref:Secreted protein n=1 Tax=Trichoderma harzianum CBS 226.95 TaxID=983964 RepID=A0A2T4AE36_TRIHA|nr:hypothetical protein M431DRAFT_506973 [Trichoderma harzianum CBS 226.95]PTB55306.1 hypothetical protein M431DRAFT_506973 [Trichoderma harzianum CBS 226.95]
MSILGISILQFCLFFFLSLLVSHLFCRGPAKSSTALLANVQPVLSAVVTWHCKKRGTMMLAPKTPVERNMENSGADGVGV